MLVLLSTILISNYSLANICDRTPQVRDALVKAAKVKTCTQVTQNSLLDITELKLTGLGITSLKPQDFQGLNNLIKLSLNENRLGKLEDKNIFIPLKNLKDLNLDNAGITNFSEDVFHPLTELESLVISLNQVRTNGLPPALLEGKTKLLAFAGIGMYFENLDETFFQRAANIKWLDISHNRLCSIPENLFKGLIQLTKVEMDANGEDPNYHCRFTTLPEGLFRDNKLVETIDIDTNNLISLPKNIFRGLTELKSLDIGGQPLTKTFNAKGMFDTKKVRVGMN